MEKKVKEGRKKENNERKKIVTEPGILFREH